MWSRTWLTRLAPGLGLLLGYQRQWWLPDLRAGLSVATVALPVAIAYAALAGLNRQQQFLHDLLSRTRLVHLPAPPRRPK